MHESLFLVHPIKLDNLTNLAPPEMAPLLQEFLYVFTEPTGLPLYHSIEHTINLILDASFPNAPSYRLAPRDIDEIECQIDQLQNSDHIQLSSSPFTS